VCIHSGHDFLKRTSIFCELDGLTGGILAEMMTTFVLVEGIMRYPSEMCQYCIGTIELVNLPQVYV
jgi:hypothetical protein